MFKGLNQLIRFNCTMFKCSLSDVSIFYATSTCFTRQSIQSKYLENPIFIILRRFNTPVCFHLKNLATIQVMLNNGIVHFH